LHYRLWLFLLNNLLFDNLVGAVHFDHDGKLLIDVKFSMVFPLNISGLEHVGYRSCGL